jgi:hypothetical protein
MQRIVPRPSRKQQKRMAPMRGALQYDRKSEKSGWI